MMVRAKKAVPTLCAAAVALFVAACASTPNAGGYVNGEAATIVQVENLNPNRVVIDALSGGIDRRLGAVETSSTDEFLLPETVSLLDLQIVVDPVGPLGSFMTPRINAGPGDIIEITVEPQLDLTTVSVR